jgi:acylphosphatase
MTESRKFRIQGRVQGVWFRESTRRQAERLGISGHAVNRPDGSVEVLAHGSPESLDQLAKWLHDGPPLARVTSVTATLHEGDRPEGFSVG